MRHLKSHLVGGGLTGVFLALGLLLMMAGPAGVLAWSRTHNAWTYMDAQLVMWGLLVILLVAGATAADYVLRRRLKIAKAYATRVGELKHALHLVGEARRSRPPA